MTPRFAGMEKPVPIPVLCLALQVCPLPIKGGPLAVSSPELPLGTVQEGHRAGSHSATQGHLEDAQRAYSLCQEMLPREMHPWI